MNDHDLPSPDEALAWACMSAAVKLSPAAVPFAAAVLKADVLGLTYEQRARLLILLARLGSIEAQEGCEALYAHRQGLLTHAELWTEMQRIGRVKPAADALQFASVLEAAAVGKLTTHMLKAATTPPMMQ